MSSFVDSTEPWESEPLFREVDNIEDIKILDSQIEEDPQVVTCGPALDELSATYLGIFRNSDAPKAITDIYVGDSGENCIGSINEH